MILHRHLRPALGALVAAALPATAVADGPMLSAGAMAFGPGNVLFVGDNAAGVVHAFDLPDTALDDQRDVSLGRAVTFEGRTLIADIAGEIGALVGTTADDIVIGDMAVHDGTQQIFLSVHVGRGPDAEPVILKVDDGRLAIVDTAAAAHGTLDIGPVPDDETLEFGQLQNTLAITDIDYFEGEVFVAGISSETFASTLRRAAYPFDDDVAVTRIEIWHAVHAQFETRAPIITQDIRVLDGEPTLIAVYACTPLVRIPVAALEDGADIRGEMIGELGFGNTPIDIVGYTDPMDGNDYVLVTNTNRSATRIALADIASAEPMPTEGPNVFAPAGVAQFPIPVTGTDHLALVSDGWAVGIRSNPFDSDRKDLHTLPLPFFFDRADHVVEMNWPGAPDPFGYDRYR